MLDNYGITVERLLRMENGNVVGPGAAENVKGDFAKDSYKKDVDFQNTLKDAKLKKRKVSNYSSDGDEIIIEAVNENYKQNNYSMDEDIVVDNSFNEKLEEQRRISKLVKDKFVDNPDLKGIINFGDDKEINDSSQEKSLKSNEDASRQEETKTASDILLEELDKKIQSLNKGK